MFSFSKTDLPLDTIFVKSKILNQIKKKIYLNTGSEKYETWFHYH